MGKGQYERRRRICEWDSERLLRVIEFVDAMPGGEIQVDIGKFRELTGIPMQSLKRHIGWAVEYGAIEVEVQYAFGRGRAPNIYRSLISLEEWLAGEGERRVAEYQARTPPVVVGAPPKPITPSIDPGVQGWDDVK